MPGFTFEGRRYLSPFIAQVAACAAWLEEIQRTGRQVDGVAPFDAPAAVDSMLLEAIEAHDYPDGDDDHRLMPLHPWRQDWDRAMTRAHESLRSAALRTNARKEA